MKIPYLSNIKTSGPRARAIGALTYLSIAVFALPAQLEAASKVTASLDSTAILMGKRATITVESVVPSAQASSVQLLVPDDTLVTNVEVVGVRRVDSIGSGVVSTLRDEIIVQSFDSGLYALPPVKVVVGNDTSLSNHLILKVVPVEVDSLKGKIHDYAGVADPGRKFLDFIPQSVYNWLLWILGALAIIAAGGYAYYRFVIKRKKTLHKAAKVQIPPYDEAMSALTHLKDEHLCENGHEREFYTRLTDILRRYLDRRFGIAAMEMTSTEILRCLSRNEETRFTRSQMQEILSMADFVKFAKVRPMPDDNVKTLRSAFDFVESTKPQPVAVESQETVKTIKK